MKPRLLQPGLLATLLVAIGCGSEPEPSGKPEPSRTTATFPHTEPESRTEEVVDGKSIPPQSESPLGSGDAAANLPKSLQQEHPEPVYRISYVRPEITERSLQQNGLVRVSLKYLDLITDLTPDFYEPLLPLPDAMMSAWEDYFGKLPPARDGSEYRITGYLMRDRELFLAAGLVKADTLLSYHGRQIGAEFWLNDQRWDYYRRHLLLHEATHAFMRHLPGAAIDLPMWYLEGMAEMLSTHRLTEDGKVEFNVMPVDRSRFLGFERIAIVQRDVKANGIRPLSAITQFGAEDFTKVQSYAWCWALCRFLDSHPKYRDRFRRIARELVTVPFRQNMAQLYSPDMDHLQTEWLLFAANVEHGFDFERASVEFLAGRPFESSATTQVRCDLGWQSSEILVEADKRYRITADGQFILANKPRPWVSEANGVSIRYSRGRPLGQLQASVLATDAGDGPPGASMLREVALGNESVFKSVVSGTLYLRVNDAWGELADNRGSLSVTVEPIADAVDQAVRR